MKTIPYGHQSIRKDDITAVLKVLKSDYLTQGPSIEQFEQALAKYVGSKYAVTFNSGTAALHSAYFAAGLLPNDRFITTSITFAATSNAGLYLGAKPTFIDVERETGNIDTSKIAQGITKKTKLIVPVHYGGNPCDLESIYRLARRHKLIVIEDAAHALGARYRNEKIGSCKFSDMAVFSFHPVKHITTGEGGAVTTNNKEFYERMITFRTHGITRNKKKLINKNIGEWYYEMHFLGFNYRMTDFQAALGLSQLKKIDKFITQRRKIAQIYNQTFSNNPYFDIVLEKKLVFNAYHLYPILLKEKLKAKKKEVFTALRESGVGVQVHYLPVYWHPYYQRLGYKTGLCHNAEDFYQREISIPLFPSLTKRDIKYVIKTIFQVVKKITNE